MSVLSVLKSEASHFSYCLTGNIKHDLNEPPVKAVKDMTNVGKVKGEDVPVLKKLSTMP
jgi:hypothetical protein